jgi:hypothetical protein
MVGDNKFPRIVIFLMTTATKDTPLATTPLFDWHVQAGGRMVDFAGWSMPVQYKSIVAEHTATRTALGLFDISHMGRILLLKASNRGVMEVKPS